MKKTAILAGLFLAFAIVSCNEKKEMEIHKADEELIHSADSLDVKVDNKFDPVCGMQTEGHVSDTIHYEGKVFGFCSTGCKETFAKGPEQYLDKLN